jgi:hypothetical protein
VDASSFVILIILGTPLRRLIIDVCPLCLSNMTSLRRLIIDVCPLSLSSMTSLRGLSIDIPSSLSNVTTGELTEVRLLLLRCPVRTSTDTEYSE